MLLDMNQAIKYLLEGLAVAAAAFYINRKNTNLREVATIGLVAAVTFLVLDLFAPNVGASARQGSGFGIGTGMVGGTEHDASASEFDADSDDELDALDHMANLAEAKAQLMKTQQLNHIQAEQDATIQQNSCEPLGKPYKIRDGQYAAKIVMPGYIEGQVGTYNGVPDLSKSAPHPWSKNGHGHGNGQAGGAEEEAVELELNDDDLGDEEGSALKLATQTDPRGRTAGVLYSGDLIHLSSNSKFMQRGVVDSQIVLDTALPEVVTNLTNLRFVHANNHDINKQTPLKYGDPVHLMHSANFNNKNEQRYVKYGVKLQSHQEGPLFRTFKIFNAAGQDNTGALQPGSDVVIARGDQEGDNIFLQVKDDKTVETKATFSEASKFKIDLKRVYELQDKNLCICPNDILYP